MYIFTRRREQTTYTHKPNKYFKHVRCLFFMTSISSRKVLSKTKNIEISLMSVRLVESGVTREDFPEIRSLLRFMWTQKISKLRGLIFVE